MLRSSFRVQSAFFAVIVALAVLLTTSGGDNWGKASGALAFAEAAAQEAQVSPDGTTSVGYEGYGDDDDEYDDDEDDDDDEYVDDDDDAPEFNAPKVDRKKEYSKFEDTHETTRIWHILDRGDLQALQSAFKYDPDLVYLRASDGRGPLFWAYEYGALDIIDFLLKAGCDPDAEDVKGMKPKDLAGKDGRAVERSEKKAETEQKSELRVKEKVRLTRQAEAAARMEDDDDDEDEYYDDEEEEEEEGEEEE